MALVTPAHADPLDNIGVRGFSTCVASSKVGAVQLLFDASSSLARTDRNNARVPAAQILLSRLSDMATALGATVDMRIWSFSSDAKPVGDWTRLDAGGVVTLNSDISNLAGANTGFETDYWTGLKTAEDDLTSHASAMPGAPLEPCALLVVLSDGEFHINARTDTRMQDNYGVTKPVPGVETVELTDAAAATQVQNAAISDLCRDGGVADTLRADGIYIVGVGLSSSDNPKFGLLQSIVTGPVNGTGGADNTCGALQPRGQFVQANNMAELLLAFDASDTVGNSTVDQDADDKPLDNIVPCKPDAKTCPKNSFRSFILDTSLSSLTILAVFDKPGVQMTITPPKVKGQPAPVTVTVNDNIEASTGLAGGVPFSYTWYAPSMMSAVSVTLDGSAGPPSWSGKWTIGFVDAASKNGDLPGQAKVSFRSDISMRLDPSSAPEFIRGEDTDLAFVLERLDGTPIPSLEPALKHIEISASIKLPAGSTPIMSSQDGDALAILSGEQTATWSVPDDAPIGSATLVTSVSLITAGGISLDTQEIEQTITIRAPYVLPTINTASVNFGTIRGTVPATSSIEVVGPGCVWVEPDSGHFTVIPQQLTQAQLAISSPASSPSTCLSLGVGQKDNLSVTMTPQVPGSGAVRGNFTVHLIPEESQQKEVTTVVPLTATCELEANMLVFIIVLTVCLLIGLGVPIFVMVWTRRKGARFPNDLTDVEAAVISAQADGDQVSVNGPVQWSKIGEVRGGGHLATIVSGLELIARAGIRFSEPGYVALVADGMVGVGSLGPNTTKDGAAVMRLGLANEWAFLAAPGTTSPDSPIAGTLVVFVPAGRPLVERPGSVDQAAKDAGGYIESLRSRLAGSTAKVRGRSSKRQTVSAPPPPPDDVWGDAGMPDVPSDMDWSVN